MQVVGAGVEAALARHCLALDSIGLTGFELVATAGHVGVEALDRCDHDRGRSGLLARALRLGFGRHIQFPNNSATMNVARNGIAMAA